MQTSGHRSLVPEETYQTRQSATPYCFRFWEDDPKLQTWLEPMGIKSCRQILNGSYVTCLLGPMYWKVDLLNAPVMLRFDFLSLIVCVYMGMPSGVIIMLVRCTDCNNAYHRCVNIFFGFARRDSITHILLIFSYLVFQLLPHMQRFSCI